MPDGGACGHVRPALVTLAPRSDHPARRVGLLLVLNPFYLDPLGIGEEQYEYRAVAVTATDQGLRYEARPPAEVTWVRGVDCFPEEPRPIECSIQAPLADGEEHATVTSDAFVGDVESYVHVDGTYYRRHYRAEPIGDGAAQVTVRYRPVHTRTVIEDASVGVEALREPHRHVVERGRLRTDEPLSYEPRLGQNTYEPAGRFVRTDDGYYLLGLEHYDPGVENRWLFSAVGVLIGVVGLVRGSRTARLVTTAV